MPYISLTLVESDFKYCMLILVKTKIASVLTFRAVETQ